MCRYGGQREVLLHCLSAFCRIAERAVCAVAMCVGTGGREKCCYTA